MVRGPVFGKQCVNLSSLRRFLSNEAATNCYLLLQINIEKNRKILGLESSASVLIDRIDTPGMFEARRQVLIICRNSYIPKRF